jgi:integrase
VAIGGQEGGQSFQHQSVAPKTMPLTDAKIRALTPGDKPIKVADEKGLFLLVSPAGGKSWRLKYRFGGKEGKLGLGRYPDVSLKEARKRRDEARQMLANGIDPGEEKKAAKAAVVLAAANSFGAVGAEYLEKIEKEGREAVTIKKSRWLLSRFGEAFSDKPLNGITPSDLLAPLKVVEDEGHYETARRMKSLASRIFRYGVATGRATSDPSTLLKGALVAPKVRSHSAILAPTKVGQLLRAIDAYDGQPLTRLALQLTPHVFVRPGELRQAEWPEFDLEAGKWTIPAEKMKMRRPHVVPLSRQAIVLLKSAYVLSTGQKYVFSSRFPGTRPMSENTINQALRRMDYSGEEMTAHGFRAMASTLLNESGKWSPDAIEKALAHDNSSTVRGTYHRGEHWAERVEMAQWWSDYLDQLRSG